MVPPHFFFVLAQDVDTLVRLAMSHPLAMLERAARRAKGLEVKVDAHVIVSEAPCGLSLAQQVVAL